MGLQKLKRYPVLSKELSLSKVTTQEGEDMILYDTAKGMKGYSNSATFAFAKRCRGDKTLEEIINELSCISGESPQKIQEKLSGLIKKMEDNGMITFLLSPHLMRAEPAEVELYSRIENVSLEITRTCNLQCKHCYSDSGTKRENELTVKEIKQLIDTLAGIGVLNVIVTGGEPMLHPRIFDIIEYIRLKPMSCMLFTNGTLLTEEVITRLKQLGILSVAISLDGAVPETHDSFRGIRGSFEKTVKAVQMLKEAGIPVRGNVCIHKGNLDEIAALVNLLEKLKVDTYRMWPVSYTGRPGESDIFVTPEEFANVLKKMRQDQAEQGTLKKEYVYSLKMRNCGIGSGNITIRSNGIVVPCVPFPDEAKIGNVRETSIADIWNDSPFLNEARRINAFDHKMCGTCDHVKVCKGGCIGDVYRRSGKLECGNLYECAYFKVYNDYIPVEIEKEVLSAEIR